MLYLAYTPFLNSIAHFSFSLSFSAAVWAAEAADCAAERAARRKGSFSLEGGIADVAVVVVVGGRCCRDADGINAKRCPPILVLLMLAVAARCRGGRGKLRIMAWVRAGAAVAKAMARSKDEEREESEERKKPKKKKREKKTTTFSPPFYHKTKRPSSSKDFIFSLASFSPRPSPEVRLRGARSRDYSSGYARGNRVLISKEDSRSSSL